MPQHESLTTLLTNIPNPMSVTLTCKKHVDAKTVDQIDVSRNIRFFLNRLNQKLFGVRFTKHKTHMLKVVPVIEIDKQKRFHTHITLETPHQLTNEEFHHLIFDSWCKTRIGYRQFDIQKTYDIYGWTDYMLKRRTKVTNVFDSVDWENVNL
jgi:hypothetical protein